MWGNLRDIALQGERRQCHCNLMLLVSRLLRLLLLLGLLELLLKVVQYFNQLIFRGLLKIVFKLLILLRVIAKH